MSKFFYNFKMLMRQLFDDMIVCKNDKWLMWC